MDAWQEEHLHAMLSANDEGALFSSLLRAARELGFEYCAYGMRIPVPLSNPRTHLVNNYPPAWQERYHSQGYLKIDPTVRHGVRSLEPLLWSDTLFAGAPQMWHEARGAGLRFGWAQAARDPRGIGGMLTLARSHERLTPAELRSKGMKMAWLAQASHLAMARCLTPVLVPEAAARLTGRELEALKWTADGKSSEEIALILGISTRTVNFHLANAVAKLGASNKLAAAVKATALGLLF